MSYILSVKFSVFSCFKCIILKLLFYCCCCMLSSCYSTFSGILPSLVYYYENWELCNRITNCFFRELNSEISKSACACFVGIISVLKQIHKMIDTWRVVMKWIDTNLNTYWYSYVFNVFLDYLLALNKVYWYT